MTIEPALSLREDALATLAGWQCVAGSIEVCALFAIDSDGRQRLLRLVNQAARGGAFEVHRSDHEAVVAAATQRGWEVAAFLHTHPDHGPEMSPSDERCFAGDTLPWIIVGTPTAEARQQAYRQPAGPSVRC